MDGETDSGERFEGPLELRVVLGHIRCELVELGRCADGLQTTVSAIVTHSSSILGLSAQVELQAADALSQRLERLAQLSEILEATVPREWTLNQARDHAVVQAFSYMVKAGAPSARRTIEEVGDCELF